MRLSRFATLPVDRLPGDGQATPAWVPPAQRRRMDPFARSACAAVDRLLAQGGALDPESALVVSTSYGAVESTMRFVGSMAEFSDRGASPTPFTSSVHNSCAGTLGELLGLHGPCTTLSQGGLGTLAALRWAGLMLGSGRAPAVLAVIGDRHNDWSRRMVHELAGCRWPIGDGVVACLLEDGPGPGREVRWGDHAAPRCIDGGGLAAADEAALAGRAAGQARLCAPERLGRWWPCCALAGLSDGEWRDAQPLALRESEDGMLLEVWLGPHRDDATAGAPG